LARSEAEQHSRRRLTRIEAGIRTNLVEASASTRSLVCDNIAGGVKIRTRIGGCGRL